MSDGLNRVFLIGFLGATPDLRFTQSGQPVLNFRMATSETFLDKDKVRRERTDWHSMVLWGARGEALSKILDKGSHVWIEGSLRTSSYDNKEGQKVYKTEIVVNDIILLGRRADGGGEPGEGHDDGEGGYQQHAGGGAGYGGSRHTSQSSTGYQPRGSGQSAGDFEIAFGRDKGKRISEVPDLSWLRGVLENDLADSSKERFHEKARGQLVAIDAELARRAGGGARAAAGAAGGGGGGYAPRGGGVAPPADAGGDDYDAGGFGNDDEIPFISSAIGRFPRCP